MGECVRQYDVRERERERECGDFAADNCGGGSQHVLRGG
jgi:hypothetical protein